MNDKLTIEDLEKRWKNALAATQTAVRKHPSVYRKLKSLAGDIVENPLDIRDYFPSATKLTSLLKRMDPKEQGSIFNFFNDRITPSSIWQVTLLRMECKDLLAHLNEFENWRIKTRHLKIIKIDPEG